MVIIRSVHGVPIRITRERLGHIADRHPEMAGHSRLVEEAIGDFLVVDALEEAKKAAAVLSIIDVRLVDDRRDASTHFAAAIGEEGLGAALLIERVRFEAHEGLFFAAQRRHPVWVAAIKPPRKVKKPPSLTPRRDGLNNHW